MRFIHVNAVSVTFQDDTLLVLIREDGKLILREYDIELTPLKDLKEFRGEKGFILHATNRGLLLSIDNRLVLTNEHGAEDVLVTQNPIISSGTQHPSMMKSSFKSTANPPPQSTYQEI
ncbi:MAG: hypothetical protein QXO15_04685 [Nitrososphaerota archaeon]